MVYQITSSQLQLIKDKFQKLIDTRVAELKELSDELSYGEHIAVEAIEKINIVDVSRKSVKSQGTQLTPTVDTPEKIYWIIQVNIYANSKVYSWDDVLYEISHSLKKIIGANAVRENEVIFTNNFGPGVDY